MICRGKVYENIADAIGSTPIVALRKIEEGLHGKLYGKLEAFNPTFSVKCRIGVAMLKNAEKEGKLKNSSVVIEPTSGNTGIGLAFACSALGYKLILTMPETMSLERRKLSAMLGADIVLTSGAEGMKGAIKKAKELHLKIKDSYMPMQFENSANPQVHRETTAIEIWEDTEGKIDIFVAGVGTGGTITGVGEVLKKRKSSIEVIAVEPDASPVLSGGIAGPHKIQGIGAGFIPKILNEKVIDGVIRVKDEDAINTAKNISKKEGILAGISSGAAIWAGIQIAKIPENKNKMIIVMMPDSGERYVSTSLSN
ncbi:MAG: cysteine synthase A [Defluviitaleaceae bacterium]|nr:cysteine synthase A [Defluviitaleaceae bacterium]